MKLTGTLKEKVDSVETKEEKKAIIAEAGMELTDDELDGVAGGGRIKGKITAPKKYCKICGNYFLPGNSQDIALHITKYGHEPEAKTES